MKPDTSFFSDIIRRETGLDLSINSLSSVAGGDINQAFKIVTSGSTFFVKTNDPSTQDMFEQEAKGLQLLQNTEIFHVPELIGLGVLHHTHYIILDFIERGAPKLDFWTEFGRKLASLHQVTQEYYGLDHHNYIGKLPQKNTPQLNWVDFFIENRLEPQVQLARNNQLIDNTFIQKLEKLYLQLPNIFPGSTPSLLHGDLWSGNFLCSISGSPCIYDPAVYYGHREMELAYTRLFGGFDGEFYQSYMEMAPLDPGFESRIDLYNLYPLLVHVNLFGSSYLSGIQLTLQRFG